MPISTATLKKATDYLHAIAIANEVLKASSDLPNETVEAMHKFNEEEYTRVHVYLQTDDLNAAGLRSLTDMFFVFWNESINATTELFWAKIQEKNLNFKRQDPLKTALKKGYFRTVHQAIDARKYWKNLKKSGLLIGRFSAVELAELDIIIQKDEQKRVLFMKKHLEKGKISKTGYLNFSNNMGYLGHCNLFEAHFSNQEIEMLQTIWNNFT